MTKILLVEDDRDLAKTITRWLLAERHTVETVYDGMEAFERLQVCKYDAVILDWMLPGMRGVDVCRQVRLRDKETPILMLTGKTEVDDKITGLDAGADDYLAKPFSLVELSARLRALLRRAGRFLSNKLTVGTLSLDLIKHTVTSNGVQLKLLPKEFALLEFLMRHPDQVFSLNALLSRVWTADSEASTDAVRTCVRRLRSSLAEYSAEGAIESLPKVGYRLNSNARCRHDRVTVETVETGGYAD